MTSLANHTEEPEMLCHQDDIPLLDRVSAEKEDEIDTTARASGTDTLVNEALF